MLAPPPEQLATQAHAALTESGVGWQALGDVAWIGQMSIVLGVAVLLAAAIAYHPTARAKAATLEQLEQPKTFIMYAMVGALVAIIVKVQPSMALVVFGIGGLMRFRTEVGEAKDTGRVILVTVIGLCCGLELYVVALLATVLAWLLIFALERRTVGRMVVRGLDEQHMRAAAEAHAAALRELGCVVVGEQRRVDKGYVALVYRAPAGVDRGALERRLAALPEQLRGTVNWES
ncbi:MAG TPA: hypothetical protein VM869_31035 [Enhygromyxa sp.]|nr:hypothetical protein [Enhygromyxa sp.]